MFVCPFSWRVVCGRSPSTLFPFCILFEFCDTLLGLLGKYCGARLLLGKSMEVHGKNWDLCTVISKCFLC
jgi:hypothetical protein